MHWISSSLAKVPIHFPLYRGEKQIETLASEDDWIYNTMTPY